MQRSQAMPPIQETEPRRPVLRIILFVLAMTGAIVTITALTVFLIYNSLKAPRHDAKAASLGITVTTYLSFPEDNIYPIGLALAPDGSFYLTQFGTGALLKADLQGKVTPVNTANTSIKAPGSVAVAADGSIYVVDYSSSNPNKSVGTLKRIAADGSVILLNTPNGKALSLFAQLAFDAAGNLYVTSPSTAEIWRFDPSGSGRVWWAVPPLGSVASQPTGIAFDSAKQALIVGDAGTGTIYQVSIGADGTAGNSVVLHRENDLEVQGVAIDERGRILFTDWQHDNGRLSRLESDGKLTLLADGFRAPTALVYRDSKAYVVNSDLLGLAQVLGGSVPSPLKARPPFTIDVVSIGN